MARIEIRLISDCGEELQNSSYHLGSDSTLNTLTKIEQSVESLRPIVLTDLSKELLQAEQSRHEKKAV